MRKKVGIIKRLFCLLLIFLLSINSFAAIVSDNDGSAFITKAEFDALKSSFQSQIDSYNQSIDSKIDGAIASYLAGIKLITKKDLEILLGLTDVWWMDDVNQFIKINRNRTSGDFQYTAYSTLKMPLTGRMQLNNYTGNPYVFSLTNDYYVDYRTTSQNFATYHLKKTATLVPEGNVPWVEADYTVTGYNMTFCMLPYDELDKYCLGVCDDLPEHVLRFGHFYSLGRSLGSNYTSGKQRTYFSNNNKFRPHTQPVVWDATNKILKFQMIQDNGGFDSDFQYFLSYLPFVLNSSTYALEWFGGDKETSNRTVHYMTTSSHPQVYASISFVNGYKLKNVMLGKHSDKKINFIKASVLDTNGTFVSDGGVSTGFRAKYSGNVNAVTKVKIEDTKVDGSSYLFNGQTDWDSIQNSWNGKELNVNFGGYFNEDFYHINNGIIYDNYKKLQPIAGGLPICTIDADGTLTLKIKTKIDGFGTKAGTSLIQLCNGPFVSSTNNTDSYLVSKNNGQVARAWDMSLTNNDYDTFVFDVKKNDIVYCRIRPNDPDALNYTTVIDASASWSST